MRHVRVAAVRVDREADVDWIGGDEVGVVEFEPVAAVAAVVAANEVAGADEAEGTVGLGVLGLGAGTLAAWAQPGDTYRFYEINPQVIELAYTEFSYLRDSPAQIEVVLGDGRLALERESPQGYDLLAADAFSSDSVPMHLITREALELYVRHLRPGGVVVFNVTNRYLDLAPVVKRLADSLGLYARLVSHTPDAIEYHLYAATDFVLVTSDSALFERKQLADVAGEIRVPSKVSVWTDDFNNLLQALR